MARLCQPCQDLNLQRSDFTSPPWLPEERRHQNVCTRTFRELRTSKPSCDLCKLIWHALEKGDADLSSAQDEDIWSLQWAQNTFDWQPDDETDGVEDEFGSALYPCLGEDGDRLDYGIQLVDDADTDGFLRGRLTSDEVNPTLLSSWIQRCKDLHGERCAPSFIRPTPLSESISMYLTVIEVNDLCLRDLPTDAGVRHPYLALSYVWGRDNHTVALKSNVEQMRRPGGLRLKLPRTIADAIEVTRALGYQYLWVDALCIVQDDEPNKQATMDEMDVIYSNSDLTIVAATSDGAESGLSGWSDRSRRRQHVAKYGEGLRLGFLPYYQHELMSCGHARRAWTYQETCLSARCLVFLNGSIYLDCSRAVWSEHVNAEVEGIEAETSANTLGKSALGTPLQILSQHVRAYTSRALTYQSDGFNAFLGILEALPFPTKSDSQYVMPMTCFDWSVLWRSSGTLIRRKGFPSWAWLGWQGEILMSQDTYGRYDQMWLLQGTWIEWHVVSSNGTCCSVISQETESSSRAREMADSLKEGKAVRVLANEHTDNSDLGSDESDANLYPMYANDSADRPFGRHVHPDAVRLLPPRPGIMRKYDSCSPADGGLLCFAAPFVEMIAVPEYDNAEADAPSTVFLHDLQGRRCGSISCHEPESTASSITVKLLVISVTSFGDLSQYHGSGLTGQVLQAYGVEDDLSDYIKEGPEGLDLFDFLNIMYVKGTDREVELTTTKEARQVVVHERAGIGFIYREALRHVGEISWTDFVLG